MLATDEEMSVRSRKCKYIMEAQVIAASASVTRAWEYVYKRFQEDATLNIYTIFEDDILFHEDFADQLHRYVEEIPSNADIIFMGWMRGAIWTTEYNEEKLANFRRCNTPMQTRQKMKGS